MSRYKSNKQAFIIAVLVILLCLVCLTGATLALFTSDVNDGTIGIVTTSGDVEVDIIDASPDAAPDTSLVGTSLKFETEDDRDEILFEPGVTFRTQGFKIKNKGNVPVNFSLYVSEDEMIDMKDFVDAFDVWIATDPEKTDAPDEKMPFLGSLGVGEDNNESDTYYLFIKMKESAGNDLQGREFYQKKLFDEKKEYRGIGVTVYAVQGNVKIY